jgi:pimeloyl-ACP methyl ester carboxylesterase
LLREKQQYRNEKQTSSQSVVGTGWHIVDAPQWQTREDRMLRGSAFSLLLCLLVPSAAISGPPIKEVEVNGVRLSYVEQGSGEPIVFVPGGVSDLRSWEPIREDIAKQYRFIAYTQRYYGTSPWSDDGKQFSVATHANDLAKLILRLNTGPVHLVGYSYGGAVAAATATENPSLIRSLTLYEPALIAVLPAESEGGRAAREDRAKFDGPAIAAAKAGDSVQAARLFVEGVFQLAPGGFDRLPQTTQIRILDNARVMPLMLTALQQSVMTCDMLRAFTQPTLLMRGERTQPYYVLINEGVSKCLPRSEQVILPNVNHNGPSRDPRAFTAALVKFLSSR